MMNHRNTSKTVRVFLAALLVVILSIFLLTRAVRAESNSQPPAQSTTTPQKDITPTATEAVVMKECIECHPDKRDSWMTSSHAKAFDNPNFQEGWKSLDQPAECLLCHTTNYQETTGEYADAGVACEACHGAPNPEHPSVDYPVRSDKEYCGTCHPSTLGEAQLSGHTGTAEVGCMDCHDPHSQSVLFENPDDMCKECHQEDLAAMDKVQAELHLRENITCAGCHTLDVPHTFLYSFRQENISAFMTGFDCSAEISANLALRTGSEPAQTILSAKMNWPVVHRISRANSALRCTDCHEMDENLRADFKALGYSDEDLNKLSWNNQDAPTVTENDLNYLISKSKPGWRWVWWLLGVTLIFAIFELFVTRKLRKADHAIKDE